MARSKVRGKCPLCLKRKKLSSSQYLGRVLHILSRDAKGQPVVMTPKLIKATPKYPTSNRRKYRPGARPRRPILSA
jgi:hypothetical protein